MANFESGHWYRHGDRDAESLVNQSLVVSRIENFLASAQLEAAGRPVELSLGTAAAAVTLDRCLRNVDAP